MHPPLNLFLTLALLAAATLPSHAGPDQATPSLLVKWKAGPESRVAAEQNTRIGSTVARNFSAIGWQQVTLPVGMGLSKGLNTYRKLDAVLAVEPDRRVPKLSPESTGAGPSPRAIGLQSLTPNDPRYGSQWYLRKIGAPEAWNVATGSSNIVVAIFDTGVDYTHPDLAANMWRNPGETGLDAQGRDKATNGVDDDGDGYVDDVHGVDLVLGNGDPQDRGYYYEPYVHASAPVYHGTFIAGLIGAVGNNGIGIAGLNWSVQIMAIRVTAADQLDLHEYFNASRLLEAWEYVIGMKRRGINIRVTSHSEGLTANTQAERDAILLAGSEGILTVVAAGNDALDHDQILPYFSVRDLAPVIVVANSTASDALNYEGPNTGSDYGASSVHIAAPGTDILSTAPGAGYRTAGGTSFSCPLVAGAAALLWSVRPGLTVDQLKAALLGSVDQPPALHGKLITNGRLNVGRALEYITNTNPPAIVLTALPAGADAPPEMPIQVTFNRPMNPSTVEAAFETEPALSGSFEWSPSDRSFVYRSSQSYDTTKSYTVRIRSTARDTQGGALDGNFDRNLTGTAEDDFVWHFSFGVPNDAFSNAQTIAGASGSASGTTYGAHFEIGEPIPSGFPDPLNIEDLASVWYRWTAPATGGWYTFDLTAGTAFDSFLAVYQGNQVSGLTPIAQSDNLGTRLASRLSFEASPGAIYTLAVIAKTGILRNQSGPFELAWFATPAPGFTGAQLSPARAIPGAKVTLTGTNLTGATAVLFNGASATFTNAPTNNIDLRITAIVPLDATTGPITIVTPHGSVTSSAEFQVLPPPLSIARTESGNVEVRWPATSDAFVLEACGELASSRWAPVANLPVHENDQTKISLNPTGKQFYRLTAR